MSENADYVRGFVDAWNAGDLSSFLQQTDADVEWVVAKEHPAATTHRGRDEISAYIADWQRTLPGLRIEIEGLEEKGDSVLAVMRMRGAGAGSGASTEVRVATVTEFRAGRAARIEEFLDPDEARRALSLVEPSA